MVEPQIQPYDHANQPLYRDDDQWLTADYICVDEPWAEDRRRQLRFRVSPSMLADDASYAARFLLDEQEDVGGGHSAMLTRSCFYVEEPFRVHAGGYSCLSASCCPSCLRGARRRSHLLITAVIGTLIGN